MKTAYTEKNIYITIKIHKTIRIMEPTLWYDVTHQVAFFAQSLTISVSIPLIHSQSVSLTHPLSSSPSTLPNALSLSRSHFPSHKLDHLFVVNSRSSPPCNVLPVQSVPAYTNWHMFPANLIIQHCWWFESFIEFLTGTNQMAVMVEQSHNAAKPDRSAGGLHLLSFSQVAIKRILRIWSLSIKN